MSWRALLAVATGGGIGSVLRYLVGFAAIQRFGPGFPWGTLIVNVTGSFAIGVIAELAQSRALGITPWMRLFIAVGVLGGYTTFSTFALDTLTLVGERAPWVALAYGAGSVLLGLAAAAAGVTLVRIFAV